MTLKNIDHVALTVSDYDGRVKLLTDTMGLVLKREGRLAYDPSKRVAILGDAAGFRLEIIESDTTDGFHHLAWLVDDVESATAELAAAGCEVTKAPFRIAPAKADSANLSADGLSLQVIRYDADSPDL